VGNHHLHRETKGTCVGDQGIDVCNPGRRGHQRCGVTGMEQPEPSDHGSCGSEGIRVGEAVLQGGTPGWFDVSDGGQQPGRGTCRLAVDGAEDHSVGTEKTNPETITEKFGGQGGAQ